MFLKNSVIKSTTVEFVGEEAIDDGGPLRELYTIFYDNTPGKLLYGSEKNCSFMHDAHRNEIEGRVSIMFERFQREICN